MEVKQELERQVVSNESRMQVAIEQLKRSESKFSELQTSHQDLCDTLSQKTSLLELTCEKLNLREHELENLQMQLRESTSKIMQLESSMEFNCLAIGKLDKSTCLLQVSDSEKQSCDFAKKQMQSDCFSDCSQAQLLVAEIHRLNLRLVDCAVQLEAGSKQVVQFEERSRRANEQYLKIRQEWIMEHARLQSVQNEVLYFFAKLFTQKLFQRKSIKTLVSLLGYYRTLNFL